MLTKDAGKLQEFMEEHPDLRADLINVKTDGFCYDIFNADNDKAHGIEMILEREGLDWNDVIAFGDSTNDTKMLEKADIGVAMGSASDYVKSYADFSTTDVFHHGLFNALKKILAEEADS